MIFLVGFSRRFVLVSKRSLVGKRAKSQKKTLMMVVMIN